MTTFAHHMGPSSVSAGSDAAAFAMSEKVEDNCMLGHAHVNPHSTLLGPPLSDEFSEQFWVMDHNEGGGNGPILMDPVLSSSAGGLDPTMANESIALLSTISGGTTQNSRYGDNKMQYGGEAVGRGVVGMPDPGRCMAFSAPHPNMGGSGPVGSTSDADSLKLEGLSMNPGSRLDSMPTLPVGSISTSPRQAQEIKQGPQAPRKTGRRLDALFSTMRKAAALRGGGRTRQQVQQAVPDHQRPSNPPLSLVNAEDVSLPLSPPLASAFSDLCPMPHPQPSAPFAFPSGQLDDPFVDRVHERQEWALLDGTSHVDDAVGSCRTMWPPPAAEADNMHVGNSYPAPPMATSGGPLLAGPVTSPHAGWFMGAMQAMNMGSNTSLNPRAVNLQLHGRSHSPFYMTHGQNLPAGDLAASALLIHMPQPQSENLIQPNFLRSPAGAAASGFQHAPQNAHQLNMYPPPPLCVVKDLLPAQYLPPQPHQHRRFKPRAPSSGARYHPHLPHLPIAGGGAIHSSSPLTSPRKSTRPCSSDRSTSPSPTRRRPRRCTSLQLVLDQQAHTDEAPFIRPPTPSALRNRRSFTHSQQQQRRRQSTTDAAPTTLSSFSSPRRAPMSRTASATTTASPRKSSSSQESGFGGFVNFTVQDHGLLMSGVAPSGSSKTKARREREAAEQQRRLNDAVVRAIEAAGGNLTGLRREVEGLGRRANLDADIKMDGFGEGSLLAEGGRQ